MEAASTAQFPVMQEASELLLAASAISMDSTDGEVSDIGSTGAALTAAETGEGEGEGLELSKSPPLSALSTHFGVLGRYALPESGWLTALA